MTASTAPTQPDKCPACGCASFSDFHGRPVQREFECGAVWYSDHVQWKTNGHFSAAIALRQKLADEKTANECLQDELTVLRAERDAVEFAAHMPADYEHGLPSWINQHLYACYIGAIISQPITDLVESGRLTFPNAPVYAELDAAVKANADERGAWSRVYAILTGTEYGEGWTLRDLENSAQTMVDERDAALARAEQAEGERDAAIADKQNFETLMHFDNELIDKLKSDRNALTARLAELQAQVKECAEVLAYCYPNEPHIMGMGDWADEQRDKQIQRRKKFDELRAALESGAESEVTK